MRFDPATGRIVKTIRGLTAAAIAASDRAVWVDDGLSTLIRIDPATNRVVARVHLAASGLGGIAVGDGAVWVADPPDGTVWRIDFQPNLVTRTASVGIGVTSVAFADGAVWAGNSFEGTVARIDPATTTVTRTFDVGGAPQGIAVDGPDVWVAVAGVPAPGPRVAGVESLPSRTCGPVVSGGGKARFLIASDLPLTGSAGTATLPMTRAIELVLQRHGFRAGKYTVAYQSCDDATAQAGNFDFATCGANAKSYARDRDLIGVIGPYNSDCARVEIPILNLARGAPVALVGTLTTNDELTRKGPEARPGELGLLYPTGRRNFVRLIAPDSVQGAGLAILARQLGGHRVEALSDGFDYGDTLSEGFVRAARRLGLQVVGPHGWGDGDYRALAARVAAAHPDAVLVAGYQGPSAAHLLQALRRRLGPRVKLLAGDGFLTLPDLQRVAGPAARGLYVSFSGRPNEALPAAGRQFVQAFAATQPSRQVVSYAAAYGAQAAEVLLAAIARSDGTRASVVRELLAEKVRGGILGDFGFNAQGDMTPSPVAIFRVVGGKRPSSTGEYDFQGSVVDRVVDVPAPLVGQRLDSGG
jgi:branched-chain amino acid transport system substrate-binding protein